MKLKQKTHRRSAVGFGKIFGMKSKPNCRAGQQRVRKQQVQFLIHAKNLGYEAKWVKLILAFRCGNDFGGVHCQIKVEKFAAIIFRHQMRMN